MILTTMTTVNSGWDIPAVSQSDLKLNIIDIVIRL
jgi:hypothetical protein